MLRLRRKRNRPLKKALYHGQIVNAKIEAACWPHGGIRHLPCGETSPRGSQYCIGCGTHFRTEIAVDNGMTEVQQARAQQVETGMFTGGTQRLSGGTDWTFLRSLLGL